MADETQTIPETLNAAADLLTPEGAWTQREYARDALGNRTLITLDATCFCVVGAISKVSGLEPVQVERSGANQALLKVINHPDDAGIVYWNDTPGRTQAEVVAALRAAAVSA